MNHLLDQLQTCTPPPLQHLDLHTILTFFADTLDPDATQRFHRLHTFRPISTNLVTSITAFTNLATAATYTSRPPTAETIFRAFHASYLTQQPILQPFMPSQALNPSRRPASQFQTYLRPPFNIRFPRSPQFIVNNRIISFSPIRTKSQQKYTTDIYITTILYTITKHFESRYQDNDTST
eukprot:GHVP01033731.1.p1 GENE.GHVP01033731.1~~GHVP01033731.1.p1  ORF type:complete len:180 (+),score=5.48 GHVP01033731.1:416-955(+)